MVVPLLIVLAGVVGQVLRPSVTVMVLREDFAIYKIIQFPAPTGLGNCTLKGLPGYDGFPIVYCATVLEAVFTCCIGVGVGVGAAWEILTGSYQGHHGD